MPTDLVELPLWRCGDRLEELPLKALSSYLLHGDRIGLLGFSIDLTTIVNSLFDDNIWFVIGLSA
jgi:hypothetical protein